MSILFKKCSINCLSYLNCTSKNDTIQESFDFSNIKPFIPPIDGGFVIKVYDGDTITIITKLPYENSELYRFSVRLSGIDTPEMKSQCIEEKKMAKEAQESLSNLILHKQITLKNVKTEKYGRILADVYLGETNINKWMLEQHLAVEYNGGTKKLPKSRKKYKSTGEM
jgi:endonuclease YncB( thermonuclease family)